VTALSGKPYITDVSQKYVVPQADNGAIVQGSHAVSSPYSSYASLLAEVGVVGFAIIVGIYVVAFRRTWHLSRFAVSRARPGDALPALALATTVALLTLVQMALLENWFEVTRVTFIAWAMLAVSCKEFDARANA
jgi:O-antigen ligase